MKRTILNNVNQLNTNFATFRENVVENNRRLQESICSAAESNLELIIHEQMEITSLAFFEDVGTMQLGTIPSKLMPILRQYCSSCHLAMTKVRLTDIGMLRNF